MMRTPVHDFYRVNDFDFWPGTDAEPLGRRPKAAALAKSHREKQRSINDDDDENREAS